MDKYVLYVETFDGFNSQDYRKAFDSIAEYSDWIETQDCKNYMKSMNAVFVQLMNALTLELVYNTECYRRLRLGEV